MPLATIFSELDSGKASKDSRRSKRHRFVAAGISFAVHIWSPARQIQPPSSTWPLAWRWRCRRREAATSSWPSAATASASGRRWHEALTFAGKTLPSPAHRCADQSLDRDGVRTAKETYRQSGDRRTPLRASRSFPLTPRTLSPSTASLTSRSTKRATAEAPRSSGPSRFPRRQIAKRTHSEACPMQSPGWKTT